MSRVMIPLEDDEREALLNLAQCEKRDPRQQAALLVRESLERRGLLASHIIANKQPASEGVVERSAIP